MARRLNERGMSLIEVMAVVAIMGILVYGIASLFLQMQKQVNAANTVASIRSTVDLLAGSVRSRDGWQNIVAAAENNATGDPASDLSCITIGPCDTTLINVTPPLRLAIYDSGGGGGNLLFDSTVPTNGYTARGLPCNTFVAGGTPPTDDPATGDDTCPISYEVSWTATCPGGATTCDNPSVQVAINFMWNPMDGVGVYGIAPNANAYSVTIVRGRGTINEPLTVAEQATGNTGPGGCTGIGSWQTRPLTTVLRDEGSNVTSATGAGVVLRAGEYSCRAVGNAFAVGNYEVRLVVNGTQVSQASGFAPEWVQTSAVTFANFPLPAGGTVQVQQRCTSNATVPLFSLGLPVPSAGGGYGDPTTFASLDCSRTN